MHIYTKRYTCSSICRMVSRLTLNFRLALTLIIFGAIASPVFAQNCNFNVNLEAVSYLNGYTTFKWSVQNTNPGDGSNGTSQDLSHWGFFLNPCIDKDKIADGESSYGQDLSQVCTGTSETVKFDRGTSGSTLSYFQIKLKGLYAAGTATAYFKFGTQCCTKQFQGIALPAPKVVLCPANQIIECPAEPNFGTPIFSSTIDISLETKYVDVKENFTGGYKIIRTWTAKDDCGGTATCSQAITVLDKTAPVINGVAGSLTIECSATPVFCTPTVSDDCDPDATLTYKDVKTTLLWGYLLVRTWTAKDACGNTSTASQTITVLDKTPPVINGVAGNLTIECSATPVFCTPTVSDACDLNATLTYNDVKTTLSFGYAITRTWTAKDASGNTSTASQIITVEDKTAPVIIGVAGTLTIECSAIPVFCSPTVSDACDLNATLTYKDEKSALSCGYSITRTWIAKDVSGNTSTASQTIIVLDKTAPVIIGVAGTLTIECSATPVFCTPTVSDICDPNVVLTHKDVKKDHACGYSITRIWTAIDACGNTVTASQEIIVQDKKPPVFSGVGPSKTIECPATPVFSTPVVTDACDANPTLTFTDVKTILSCGSYAITRTWKAKDACGNTSTASQKITVQDKKGPIINGVAGSKTIECPASPVFSTPTATDACDANPTLTFTDVKTDLPCGGYSITRTWRAKDVCGNVSTKSQKITVQDKKGPAITGVGGSKTIECPATPVFSTPAATDACDANPTLTFTDVKTTSACGYAITRTWKAKDVCGNTTTASQKITVLDKKAPVIIGVGGSLTVDCSTPPPFSNPTVSDGCDASPVLTYNDVTTQSGCSYIITRTWTAKDACGNTATAKQTITMQDKTAPVISGVSGPVTAECSDSPQFCTPSVSDVCDPNPTLTYVDATTQLSCGYSITRTWTAKDACGNTSKASQTITMEDKTAPVISGVAGSSTIDCSATPVFSDPTVSDACDPNAALTYKDETTVLSCGYSITRTWTAKDACGNTSTASQTITVQDKTAPVISGVAGPSTIDCSATPVFSDPAVSDACDPNATLTYKDVRENLSCGYKITRTWTAKDACGNTSTACQTITVQDKTAPLIKCVINKSISCGAPVVFDQPTATDACDSDPTIEIISDVVVGNAHTRTWIAIDDCGNKSLSCSQTITIENCAHIFPSQATCCNYINNTASPLLQVCYTQSIGKVLNALPGAFFYYATVVAPSANFVIDVNQTNNASGFNLFSVQSTLDIHLTDASCGNTIKFTAIITSGSQVTCNVKDATPGATYIVSVRYNSMSIIGSLFTATAPPNVTYNLKTYLTPEGGSKTLVSGSVGSLQAKNNCSDNTPLPQSCSQPSYSMRKASAGEKANKPSSLSVSAYPNPYVNEVKFAIQSPVSGKGSLDVYNTFGQKLKTIYQGYITEGKILTVSYKVPPAQQANLMYVLHVGGRKVSGMVMKF